MFKRKESSSKSTVKNITPEDANDMIKNNEGNLDLIVLDVRSIGEFNQSHLKNVILIDYNGSSFKEEVMKLDTNKKYILYCRSGVRSAKASNMMAQSGFNEVYNMLGGINLWSQKGLPLIR
jgi:rhodanese-related sulfurtransferase